ncbi:MAG: AtpZ/AtpI family protein [Planctomycetota bacterium]|nr:AtpZ/AtpI family protein [Planctomycetota bacterium]
MTFPDPPDEQPKSPLALSTVGMEFALGILLLGWLGWLADGVLGWRSSFPVFMVSGVFLGFGWGIWRLVRRINRRDPPR